METIARFPALRDAAQPAAVRPAAVRPAVVMPARALADHPARPRRRSRDWVHMPLVALVGLALAAWALATWNEQQRLVRQRGERLAREPVSGTIRP